jgi:hypothetical protein
LTDNRNEQWLPLLRPYDAEGSDVDVDVDVDTGKDTYLTDPNHCPVTHGVLDSGFEQKVAQVLESLPQVAAYVKNDRLGFVIPYTLDGEQRSYLPDFLVRARVGDGDTPLTLHRGGLRRRPPGQDREGLYGAGPVGAGRQRTRRLRALALRRGQGSLRLPAGPADGADLRVAGPGLKGGENRGRGA